MSFSEILKKLADGLDFSTESLAEAAGVSCEAISLWLDGLAVPTAEELERLRGVLGEGLPEEVYMLSQSPEELNWLYRLSGKKHLLPRAIFALLSAVATGFQFAAGESSTAVFYALCTIFFAITAIRVGKALASARRESLYDCMDKSFEYAVFSSFMMITLRRGGDVRRQLKADYDRITKTEHTGAHFLLYDGGVCYPIRLSAIRRDSVLRRVLYPQRVKQNSKARARQTSRSTSQKLHPQRRRGPLSKKSLSAALAVLSILSLLVPYILGTAFNASQSPVPWICYVFIPIPLASAVWGIVMNAKGHWGYVKNIVIGCICAAFLILAGSVSSDITKEKDEGLELLHAAEDTLGIELPDSDDITLTKWDSAYSRYSHVYYMALVRYEREASDLLEKNLDGRWMDYIPTDMLGLCPVSPSSQFNLFLIYNMDSGEFNRLPSADGSYRFMNVYYDSANNTMRIIEHQTEYRK